MAGEKMDKQMQEFLEVEQQKAQLQVQIHRVSDACWDICMTDKVRDKMDSKTEGCLTNCVDRFIDVSFAITGRFQQMLQQHGSFQQ